jgi:hypothetical protein
MTRVAQAQALLRSADLYVDALDASSITLVGSKVSAWANKGTAAVSLVQTVNGARPSYGTRTVNGRPVLDFVRANAEFLDAGDVLDLGTNAFSSVSVFGMEIATTSMSPWGKHIASAGDGRYGLLRLVPDLIGVYDEGPAAGFVQVSDSSLDMRLISTVLTRDGSSSSHVINIDGVVTTKNFTDPGTSWNTSAPFRIGRYGTSTSFDLDGPFGMLALWLRTLTSYEMETVRWYLRMVWGTA